MGGGRRLEMRNLIQDTVYETGNFFERQHKMDNMLRGSGVILALALSSISVQVMSLSRNAGELINLSSSTRQ